MKLLYCPACKDIIRLRPLPRKCYCGEIMGKLLDAGDIDFTGNCHIIEINNRSLKNAINRAWLRSTNENFNIVVNHEDYPGKYDPQKRGRNATQSP